MTLDSHWLALRPNSVTGRSSVQVIDNAPQPEYPLLLHRQPGLLPFRKSVLQSARTHPLCA